MAVGHYIFVIIIINLREIHKFSTLENYEPTIILLQVLIVTDTYSPTHNEYELHVADNLTFH